MSSIRSLAIADSGFVFDPQTGHSYSVNPTGLAVLRALKEGLALDEIRQRLEVEFDEAACVEDDLEDFVRVLRDHGLVAADVRLSREES